MPGLVERLQSDLEALAPVGKQIRVTANHDRQYAVWNGASLVAELPTFQSMWCTRAEYDEFGPSIVTRKCY